MEPTKERCKSILVADDNDDIRETIIDALRSEGYIVYGADHGREVLDLLTKIPGPTLILLDLMMPVMNGWEFLDAQRQDARLAAHQVVTVSAVNPTQSLEDPTPLKTAGALSKPISLDSLWQEVRRFCGPPPSETLSGNLPPKSPSEGSLSSNV